MKLSSLVFSLSLLIIFPVSARTILILGDSLSAGYGIAIDKGWVKLLETKLAEASPPDRVINVSTSGDTTSNGLAKLPKALEAYQPDVIVIELGANDGLRGLPLITMKKNLSQLVALSQKAGACVLLIATPLPPNYGSAFLAQFNDVYKRVADTQDVKMVPMPLEGFAGNSKYMQEDGLHPNEAAQEIIFAHIWPVLESSCLR